MRGPWVWSWLRSPPYRSEPVAMQAECLPEIVRNHPNVDRRGDPLRERMRDRACLKLVLSQHLDEDRGPSRNDPRPKRAVHFAKDEDGIELDARSPVGGQGDPRDGDAQERRDVATKCQNPHSSPVFVQYDLPNCGAVYHTI